jgi:iron complex outermembrane receptor protein
VLINGRRDRAFPLAQNGTDAFVDLNGIPLSAVDRIEILKESASAVYGADAIAGVINVISKTNYTGLEVETYYREHDEQGLRGSARIVRQWFRE